MFNDAVEYSCFWLPWYVLLSVGILIRCTKIALKWMPKQKRARGRPKKNWMEGIKKAMNERNLNEGQWEDMKQWSLGVGQRRKTFWTHIYIHTNFKRREVAGGQRKFLVWSFMICNPHCFIRMIKSRRWDGQGVWHSWEKTAIHTRFCGKRCRKVILWMSWLQILKNRMGGLGPILSGPRYGPVVGSCEQYNEFFRFHKIWGIFLAKWETVSFWRGPLLHWISMDLALLRN